MGTEEIKVQETQLMDINIEALVTFSKGYRIAEGGTTNEGITLNYILTKDFSPCENPLDSSKGYKVSKSSIPTHLADKLTCVPGIYTMHCKMGVASNGNPVLKPYDLDLKSLVSLTEILLDDETDKKNNANPSETSEEKGRTNKPVETGKSKQ